MQHVKLFESFGAPERGISEFELSDGVGMLIYDILDNEKMKELYEQFHPDEAITYEEFLKNMSTPGIQGEREQGGPWEIIGIGSETLNLDGDRYFGMIYRF